MEEVKEVKVEKKGGNIWWSSQMDRVLVDALYEQFLAGEKPDRTMSPRAYDIITNTVIEKTHMNVDKKHVKNRIKTLRNNFNSAYDIFKGRTSGFSWNPITFVMDAEDEVWEELIQVSYHFVKLLYIISHIVIILYTNMHHYKYFHIFVGQQEGSKFSRQAHSSLWDTRRDICQRQSY